MRLKLSSLLFFIFSVMWSQTTLTFSIPTTSTFKIPAGVTSLNNVECWGAGGAGGGATAVVSVFGGGGGGGGAYSKITSFSVTPAAVLSYKVGAGGVGSIGTDGSNGEATSFSTISANGGVGGKNGNSSNGAGGAGGLASGAGTIFSGGAGGTPGLVGGILSSGGGGGSAGTASNGNNGVLGTGGTAVAGGGAGSGGVLLAGNGIDNVSLGGGGGGAKGLLFSAYKGGKGGNGQIKFTYSCPVYALTSATTADDVCTTIGSTSLVRLTGGLSLPNGDYEVTYNRSSPNATGLTATMSVTGGTGTGTFTAVGLSTIGSSTITVTNLTSESCTNVISTNSTVTINVYSTSVGGSINTPAAICSGGTSGLLTLSGHTGAVLRWEYAVSPFSSWIPIINATATYSPGALTQTTQFRAVVKNGSCSQTTSTPTTVTVNPIPTIITSGTLDNICFNSNSQMATLPYSATTNTPINYSIVWNPTAISAGLANQGTTPFSFFSGGGSLNTIAIPAGVPPSTYLGTMTISNSNCSVTQPIQLTIVPKPSAPIPGAVTEPTCVTSTGGVILSGLPASVTWLIRQTGTAVTTYSGTGTSYDISDLAPGNYAFTVEYTGSCISQPSANVVVNNLVTNVYSSSGWSNGTPTINQDLVFNSDYATAGGGLGDIIGCTCWINSGINVEVNNGDTLTINKAVVNDGGTLTFDNNASLVQMADVTNIGNIIYQRISKPMKNLDYTYWSSPVVGQTLVGLSPNTLSDKYLSYTGTGWKVETPSNTMQKGVGYIIRTPKEGIWPNGEGVSFPYSQSVEFIGVPNNGNVSGQSVTAGNFYLIGNPYPSAVSADAFLFANPNNNSLLDGTIYFWTHNTAIQQSESKYIYVTDDYASYNGTGGVLTLPAPSAGTGGLNTDIPSGAIAAGQSFFASAKNPGTIVFNNSMRMTGNNNQFFKPAKTSNPTLLEKHRVWLNMTNDGGAFKQLLIGYVEGATNGYDSNFDGITFDGNTYIDFYSIDMDSHLVIQGRGLPFTDSDTVSLGYRTIIAGNFTISINQADGILNNQPVYLEDKLTNTIYDLKQSDYNFTTATGVFNNRFVLRYKNNTLAAAEFERDNNVLAWIDNKSIKLSSTIENINKIFIYNASGKLAYSDSEISSSEVVIKNVKFKNEALIIKIVLANNDIITKKIIAASK